MPDPLIKYIFIELTNHCNFSCTFCPDGIMTRKRRFMDVPLVYRLLDEIEDKGLTNEPIQLHLMGEPLLHPHIFDIISYMHKRNLHVRLFSNGALLDKKRRDRIYKADIEELVIGIHTFTPQLYRDHRRGKPDYFEYIQRIQDCIEDKFRLNSSMCIYIQYLNTKSFNAARLEKNYPDTLIPLVDNEQKAFAVLNEWKDFGKQISEKYDLDFLPKDLECLKGRYKDYPLDCLKGDHCEILPDVIFSFKDISSFSDYLHRNVRYVERYKAECPSYQEQLAVLADGTCTPCCVDYDGKIAVGNANLHSLESIWLSEKMKQIRETGTKGLLPTPVCRICKSILVEDDYQRQFETGTAEAYSLVCGWYPLERAGEQCFRWMGKRAVLETTANRGVLEMEVKNTHPHLEKISLFIRQGDHDELFEIDSREWKRIEYPIKAASDFWSRIIIESSEFWIPAELLPNNEDHRELSIMVKNMRLIL
jgi:MoaA/NifB/PqqE/SkfB family radical SAM enzyme